MDNDVLNKRQMVEDRLDIGHAVAYHLKIKQEPVPEDLLFKFLFTQHDGARFKQLVAKANLNRDEELELANILCSAQKQINVLKELEECGTDIPRHLMQRLCRCSTTSLFTYDRKVLKSIKEKCYDHLTQIEGMDVPRPNL